MIKHFEDKVPLTIILKQCFNFMIFTLQDLTLFIVHTFDQNYQTNRY